MSSLRLLTSSVLTGSTMTLLFPHMRGIWVGNAVLALSWAQGTLAPPSPPHTPPPPVLDDPQQLTSTGKYVLILKQLQCLGAGCQEMVGSSRRWGGARPWGDCVPREPPCQAETGSEG